MSEQLLTTLPFNGFYETLHSAAYDDAIEQLFSDSATGCEFDPYDLDPWQAVDSSNFNRQYAKAYVNGFNEAFALSLTFDRLESPREYNFATDRIFAYITLFEFTGIMMTIDREALDTFINERFSHRSGFISHYPNRLADWSKDLTQWDHNQIGTVLAFMASEQELDQWSLMEDYSGNGYFQDWVLEGNDALQALSDKHYEIDSLSTERNRNGSITVSDIISGHLQTLTYYDYDETEAKLEFYNNFSAE